MRPQAYANIAMKEDIPTLAMLLGIACWIAAPIFFLLAFMGCRKLGRAITSVNPSLWEEMRPGLYTDIRVSKQHRERLSDFIATGEYLALKNPNVNRLAARYQLLLRCLYVALAGAAMTIVIALKYG